MFGDGIGYCEDCVEIGCVVFVRWGVDCDELYLVVFYG